MRTREEKLAYNKAYYVSNKERLLANNKAYRNLHKERLSLEQKQDYQKNKEAYKEEQKKYRDKPEAKLKTKERNLKKLGWTLNWYFFKKEEQKDLCAICKIPTAPRAKGDTLVADHEHTIPLKPRGLLCTHCNTGIGQFLDNPIFLIEATLYLAKYALDKDLDAQSNS